MGAKKLYLIAVYLILGLSLLSFVNASIIVSQPNALYSLGDELSFSVTIDSIKTGYMDVNLACPGTVENIYQDVPSSTTISITRTLTPTYIKTSNGECHLVANYADESALSQTFNINKNIEISVSTNNLNYRAGEDITVAGTAYKANNELVGQKYKAYVEVIMNEEVKAKAELKDSQFSINFKTPETTTKGSYILTVKVTEEDSEGNVLNYGETTSNAVITQITSKIDLAMDKQSIVPGENITLIPSAYDMAGDIVTGKIALIITDSSGNKIYEGNVDSNQNVVLETKTTNPAGTSKISASIDNIIAEKFFQINELKKISAQIVNNTLVITNIGNIPYSGIVDVNIGGQIITKEIELGLGESRVYGLSAPDGAYDVLVSDGSEVLSESGVSLTGDAISMNDAKNAINRAFTNYPIVWIFLIIVIALFIGVYYKRHGENKRFGFTPFGSSGSRMTSAEKKRGGVEVIKPETILKKADEAVFDNEVRKAEQLTVLHGQKQPVSIISLKIKNSVSGISKESINQALEYAYKKKAVSYTSGNYIVLIFSPLLTKSMANEETAVRTAIEMDNILKEHNRKFRNDNINFGIGVNSGELINKMAGRVLQFTNISNTLNLAKRISEASNEQVLLSKQIHEKTLSNIRAEKATTGNLETFAIKRVVDNEKSAKFIQGFLRRNNP